ncbi:hypothetical protein ACH5RR_039901 [Cinchona calisaya]|uniref:RRM domain-containing protein n=1 Tax=Cinchona calisaya TaxID=153742 RepID=A0ABD2Y575_9GENT
MGDPYWRYSVPPQPEGGSIPKPSFPGYLSSDATALTTHQPWSSNDARGSSDYLEKDILQSRSGAYGVDVRGIHPEAGLGGLTSETSIRGYPSTLRDPSLPGQIPAVAPHLSPGIHDTNYERPSSLRRTNGVPVATGESNILFVDGLPTDCSRREVGHLFRPFIGFKELKVVHKEPRRSGDKAMVLCFVEFTDAKCALTAMEALQGYKFDDRKPDSPVLRIHFANFPFRLPSDRDDQRFGGWFQLVRDHFLLENSTAELPSECVYPVGIKTVVQKTAANK